MSNPIELRKYLPYYYEGVLEFETFIEAENKLLQTVDSEYTKLSEDQFVITAHLDAVEQWESILAIEANPATETLQFRRERIINRLSTIPPFSMPFLRKRLDEIVGKDKWNAYLDFDNYTLYIETITDSYEWYNELAVTITAIKPCNITFVNKPVIMEDVHVSEEVVKVPVEYYYKLGFWKLGLRPFSNLIFNYKLGKWQLGKLPFMSYRNEEVVKLATTPSIQDKLLERAAQRTEEDVDHIVLNYSYTIPKDRLKIYTSDSTVYVSYNLFPSDGISIVTHYDVQDKDGTSLSKAVVAVPITDTVIMEHRIRFKEGV